jgi:hypothetical protein
MSESRGHRVFGHLVRFFPELVFQRRPHVAFSSSSLNSWRRLWLMIAQTFPFLMDSKI